MQLESAMRNYSLWEDGRAVMDLAKGSSSIYNVMSQHWSQMPDLQMARRDHGCSLFGETPTHIHRGTKKELYIVIAGGTNGAGTLTTKKGL